MFSYGYFYFVLVDLTFQQCLDFFRNTYFNRKILRSLVSQLPLQLHAFVLHLTEPLPPLSFFEDPSVEMDPLRFSLDSSILPLFEKMISQRKSLFLVGSSPDLLGLFHPPFLETFLFLTQENPREQDFLSFLRNTVL